MARRRRCPPNRAGFLELLYNHIHHNGSNTGAANPANVYLLDSDNLIEGK